MADEKNKKQDQAASDDKADKAGKPAEAAPSAKAEKADAGRADARNRHQADAEKEKKGAKVEGAEGKEKAVVKSKKSKAKRRIVTEGRVYIQASFNNTIITVTDPKGEVISWSSAGANGFKGPKKATPYAAQVSAENAIGKAKVYGLEKVIVFVKGAGSGREQAIRGLQAGGVNIESITDVTPVAHNGCRPRKSRRV